jgi:hypothetical protein
MNRFCTFLTGASLGAGAMYFFDPVVGNRRRSLVRDQFIHAVNKAERAADATLRDVQNRAYGTVHELRNMITGDDRSPDEETLINRVRSKMGRYVSHPAAIDVSARDGIVRLSGPILADEVDDLISAVKSVRGVDDIEDRLDVHDSPDNISALQGGRTRTGETSAWQQESLSPAMRALLGLAGGVLALDCVVRRTPTSAILGTAGAGLIYQALVDYNVGELWPEDTKNERQEQPRKLSGFGKGTGSLPPEVQELHDGFEHQSRQTQETRADHPI